MWWLCSFSKWPSDLARFFIISIVKNLWRQASGYQPASQIHELVSAGKYTVLFSTRWTDQHLIYSGWWHDSKLKIQETFIKENIEVKMKCDRRCNKQYAIHIETKGSLLHYWHFVTDTHWCVDFHQRWAIHFLYVYIVFLLLAWTSCLTVNFQVIWNILILMTSELYEVQIAFQPENIVANDNRKPCIL